MKKKICPFCKYWIKDSYGQTFYDHWCDMDDFDEIGKAYSDLLEKEFKEK